MFAVHDGFYENEKKVFRFYFQICKKKILNHYKI